VAVLGFVDPCQERVPVFNVGDSRGADGDINPEKFLGISDNERTGFKSINVNIELRTNADKATEALLIEKVKSRCPVNDNLANPTPIQYSFN
jgi:uncharacterized OsmC-like protein